mmetsp:Transcript_26331/g.70289  ORF Transcript_26331/g.70289 Transcript_26331/m.70289 type:complete len:202 (+) Transcript_26331:64-669(+)
MALFIMRLWPIPPDPASRHNHASAMVYALASAAKSKLAESPSAASATASPVSSLETTKPLPPGERLLSVTLSWAFVPELAATSVPNAMSNLAPRYANPRTFMCELPSISVGLASLRRSASNRRPGKPYSTVCRNPPAPVKKLTAPPVGVSVQTPHGACTFAKERLKRDAVLSDSTPPSSSRWPTACMPQVIAGPSSSVNGS